MAAKAKLVLGNRFVQGDKIAAGGMATVYEATCVSETDPLASTPLAVKLLHDHLAENSAFIRMFREEGDIAKRFTNAHIVKVHAVGHDQGRHYIVMNRVDGENLSAILVAHNRAGRGRGKPSKLEKGQSYEILSQVLTALKYVHSFKGTSRRTLGIVHRDISPHNILIDRRGRALLTDFGIARGGHRSTDWTETGTVKGKLHYMSPEQARGKKVDHRADLYAVGVVAWELFVGEPLVDAAHTHALQQAKIAGFVDVNHKEFKALPQELRDWLLRALSVEPKDRHQSAEAMQAELERIRKLYPSSSSKTVADLLDIAKDPSPAHSQQMLIDQDDRRRAFSMGEPPRPAPMPTPQRPIDSELLGPGVVSVDRRSPSERIEQRQRAKPVRTRDVEQLEGHAAQLGAAVALQAAGVDISAQEHLSRVSRVHRLGSDREQKVSRVYANEQKSLVFSSMVAWTAVLILCVGTLMDVKNLRLTPPAVTEQTFVDLRNRLLGGESEPVAAEERVDAELGAARQAPATASTPAAPKAAPMAPPEDVAVSNDRFLPRRELKQPAGKAPPRGSGETAAAR